MKYIHVFIQAIRSATSASFLIALLFAASCKKFVTIPPTAAKVDLGSVFQSDAAAIALMNGIYVQEVRNTEGYFCYISRAAGLSADELTNEAGTSVISALYTNSLTSSSFSYFWSEFYTYLYTANEIIDGVKSPNSLSPTARTRLEGEAKFTRALLYFYLINLHGDVPLVTSTNYLNNLQMGRSSMADVYLQIIKDLQDAENLLGEAYTTADLKTVSTTDRLRPNKWAAAALLARVYLFTGDNANAITESTKVISQSSVYKLETLNNVFLATSKEAIWQLQPTGNLNYNTFDGNTFILVANPDYGHPVSISSTLYAAFEAGDNRKTNWIGTYIGNKTYYFPYKYKVGSTGTASVPLTEDQMVLRLGEQYLIRAEANVQSGNIADAIADLNTLRARARAAVTTAVPNPLPALSATISKTDALAAVEHERQVEMFTEFGDRWLTLKRLRGFSNPSISRADEIMPAITKAKGGTWSTNWQLYPIPFNEIRDDPALTQNPGY